MTTLPIAEIRREPELQCRAKGVNKHTVAEYAAAMKAGATFPPVVVFRDGHGVCWLGDGFHRLAAAELSEQVEISVDVREGSKKDALLHSAGANASHGLRRTNADKRRAVIAVLQAFPKMSDRKIGETCGVDNKTVAAARRSLSPGEEIPQPDGAATVPGESDTAASRVDLGAAYLDVLMGHSARPADEHRQAFEGALALAFAPGPKRRRIVQPSGIELAATNGGE